MTQVHGDMADRGVAYVLVVKGSKDITLIYFCICANFRTMVM